MGELYIFTLLIDTLLTCSLTYLRWRFGAVGSDVGQINEVTIPGPVSTGMGDRIGVQLPVWEICLSLTNHLG